MIEALEFPCEAISPQATEFNQEAGNLLVITSIHVSPSSLPEKTAVSVFRNISILSSTAEKVVKYSCQIKMKDVIDVENGVSQQGGLYFGLNEDNHLRLVLDELDKTSVLLASVEINAIAVSSLRSATRHLHYIYRPFSAVELKIEMFLNTLTAVFSGREEGETWIEVMTSKFPASWLNSVACGLIASHGNSNASIIWTFNSFKMVQFTNGTISTNTTTPPATNTTMPLESNTTTPLAPNTTTPTLNVPAPVSVVKPTNPPIMPVAKPTPPKVPGISSMRHVSFLMFFNLMVIGVIV
jgi:hypothetical protein